MATHTTLSSLFTAIADAIREKTGGTDTIVADDFPTAIAGISTGPSLEDCTWELISAISAAGMGSSLFSVGDTKSVAISGTVGALDIDGTYYAFILGFNHNSSVEGGNSIHFQFGKDANGADIAFVDSSYNTTDTTGSTAFKMNLSQSNAQGWSGSYMRNTICPAFLAALPADLQNIIAACAKYSDNTGGGSDTASYVTSTSDKIWLLAEFEVFGKLYEANSAEQNYQQQYDYYKNGNSKLKYKHSDTATVCTWWLRSANVTTYIHFQGANAYSTASGFNPISSQGFAPGFKVA